MTQDAQPSEGLDEEDGVRAILWLQKYAGSLVQTEQQARMGWRAMTDATKRITLLAYHRICLARIGAA